MNSKPRRHKKVGDTSIYHLLEQLDDWLSRRVDNLPNLQSWQFRGRQIYGNLADAETAYIFAYKAKDVVQKLEYLNDMSAHMTAVREGMRRLYGLQKSQQKIHVISEQGFGHFLGMMQRISMEVGALMRSLSGSVAGENNLSD